MTTILVLAWAVAAWGADTGLGQAPDTDVLRLEGQWVRFHLLAHALPDIGVYLTQDQVGRYGDPLVEWNELSGKFDAKQISREQLLKDGADRLKARQADLDKWLGVNAGRLKAAGTNPLVQAYADALVLQSALARLSPDPSPRDRSGRASLRRAADAVNAPLARVSEELEGRRLAVRESRGVAPTPSVEWLRSWVQAVVSRVQAKLTESQRAELQQVLPVVLPDGGVVPVAPSAGAVTAPKGKRSFSSLDPEMLRTHVAVNDLSQLISSMRDAGVTFPPAKASHWTFPVDSATINYYVDPNLQGSARDAAIAAGKKKAAEYIRKRSAELDADLGPENARKVRETAQTPYHQASSYMWMLNMVLGDMHVPVEQYNAIQEVKSKFFDPVQKQYNDAMSKQPLGPLAAVPGLDAAWLSKWRSDLTAAVLAKMTAEQQKAFIDGWPTFCPGAPVPSPVTPTTDDFGLTLGSGSDSAIATGAPPPPMVSDPAPRVPSARAPATQASASSRAPSAAPPVATPPASRPTARAGDSRSTDWIDPLKSLDIDRQTISGAWELADGVLSRKANLPGKPRESRVRPSRNNNGSGMPRLALPVEVTGGFEWVLTFNRTGGAKEFCLIFPAGNTPAQIWIGGMFGQDSSLQGVGETHISDKRIFDGKDQTLHLTVTPDGDNVSIELQLDGNPYISYSGPQGRLSANPGYAMTDPHSIGLTVHRSSSMEFKNMKIRATTGTVRAHGPAEK